MTDAYNAAERRDVRAAEKAAKIIDAESLAYTSSVMSSATGRAWMLDILELCHIFTTTYSSNPYDSAFNEGQRSMGLALLDRIMRACPNNYSLMMAERNSRDAARSNTRQRPRSQNGDGGNQGPDSAGAGDDLVERED